MSRQLIIIAAAYDISPVCVHLLSSQTCHHMHPISLSTCQQLQHMALMLRYRCDDDITQAKPFKGHFQLSIWMASALGMTATQKSWGDTRPYAVLQRTPDKDCRQAEKLKQLVDEASRLHLGRQCQHSTVICSGALLFSSRVLRPSLITLCSHKSG